MGAIMAIIRASNKFPKDDRLTFELYAFLEPLNEDHYNSYCIRLLISELYQSKIDGKGSLCFIKWYLNKEIEVYQKGIEIMPIYSKYAKDLIGMK